MVRIAPVRLAFNPKTLWFDAGDLQLALGDAVVVSTVRGKEFGRVSQAVFDMEYEETRRLKSPLKPVLRVATEEDEDIADEKSELSLQALPVFRRLAADYAPDMNPIAVEYLFDSDKAVFYFDAEERVDFRDLVRKLAAELQVRVDMKQVGVRDGVRMVGGYGHCGQELCCRRLGGDFNHVSIRMAKEQDLSLNPQKISGVCGRLMCCLRYEFEAYKDFHSRAPKKNARIQTPEGEGKVVDLDVPREVISIKVGDEKPVKVPLADMDAPEEGARPTAVSDEAWEQAKTPATMSVIGSSNLFASQLSGEDKLAEPGKVNRVHGEEPQKSTRSRRRRRGSGRSGDEAPASSSAAAQGSTQPRKQRRRSTKVSADGTTIEATQRHEGGREQEAEASSASSQKRASSSRRRSRNRSGNSAGSGQHKRQEPRQADKQKQQSQQVQQGKSVKVGRNSSALRAGRDDKQAAREQGAGGGTGTGTRSRRRRRSHKPSSSGSVSES